MEPRVSEKIPQIVDTIQRIVDREHAYCTPDGDVYFSIESLSCTFSFVRAMGARKEKEEKANCRLLNATHSLHQTLSHHHHHRHHLLLFLVALFRSLWTACAAAARVASGGRKRASEFSGEGRKTPPWRLCALESKQGE